MSTSLPERLVGLYGNAIARRLDVQYRMHADIMGFSSAEFYDAALVADPSVAGHRLSDCVTIESAASDLPLLTAPLEFIDTAGAGYEEQLEPDGESRVNPQEAELVHRLVERLIASGVPAESIGVIAPYSAQVRLLRTLLNDPQLDIDSVDGFQGREKEAIVISLVRSNANGEIGFLSDTRRMNVALTRAAASCW